MSESEQSASNNSSSFPQTEDPQRGASETAAQLLDEIEKRDAPPTQPAPTPRPAPAPPSTSTQRTPLKERILHSDTCSAEELAEIRKEIDTQDQIITALQRDNEALHTTAKQLQVQTKEAGRKLANLEAKHSLLLSSTDSVPADHSAELRKLVAKNKDLQRLLEGAEMSALTAKNEARKLLTEVQKAAVLEADLRSARLEQKQRDLAHGSEISDLHAHIADMQSQIADLATIKDQPKTVEKANVSVASIDHVEVQDTKVDEIRRLLERIRDLERVLQKRNSENVKELIQTMQPLEQPQVARRLEARVQQLEQALGEKDMISERMVDRLRTEAAKVRSTYEDKIAHLEDQLHRAKAERVAPPAAGPARLERREFSANASVESATMPDKQVRFANESMVRERAALKDRAAAVEAELEKYKNLLDDNRSLLRHSNAIMDQQSQSFKEDFLQQLRSLRQKHNEDIDRLQRYHKEEMDRAHAELGEIRSTQITWQPPKITTEKPDSAEKEKTFLESVVQRLSYLERHCLQREKEAAFENAEVKRIALAEQRLQSERYEIVIAHKNQQIDQFQLELDDLLTSISLLKHSARV